jgi:hypothetical protein
MREMAENSKSRPKLDRNVRARLGQQLRAMYDEITYAPLPEQLQALMDELKAAHG